MSLRFLLPYSMLDLFCRLIVGALIVIVAASVLQAAPAVPAATMTEHALQHEEASMIQQCANKPDSLDSVWINSRGERLNCLIRFPDGAAADYVIQWCKKAGWIVVTAYLFNPSLNWKEIYGILRGKGCEQVWP